MIIMYIIYKKIQSSNCWDRVGQSHTNTPLQAVKDVTTYYQFKHHDFRVIDNTTNSSTYISKGEKLPF